MVSQSHDSTVEGVVLQNSTLLIFSAGTVLLIEPNEFWLTSGPEESSGIFIRRETTTCNTVVNVPNQCKAEENETLRGYDGRDD